jgi:RNA polymerase sigma-70 factor (ECF subfamily)
MQQTPALEQDRLLVKRLLEGEERAFREFFDAYFARLYRFALPRLGGDEGWAEDAIQAAMGRALRRLESWRGEASLYTWLCQICRNEIVDLHRREGRQRDQLVSFEDQEAADFALDTLQAGADSQPETRLADRDLQRTLGALLDGLSPGYGDALVWKYVEGLSVEEIGERLEIGTVAAQSLLARARQAFKTECLASFGKSADTLLDLVRI